MFTIFQEEKLITAGILTFLIISLSGRILLGYLYQTMIREADNMATTNNQPLKQCKLKFANCYQMNNGVANIPIFVDKFLNKLKVGPFLFSTIYHFSGQSMLLSVIFCGLGSCKGIADGRKLGDILPFYIVSFLGLYLYFTISALADIRGKRRILKVNLVDYLENHLSARMDVTESDIRMLYGENTEKRGRSLRLSAAGRKKEPGKKTVELMPIGTRRAAEQQAAPEALAAERKSPAPPEKEDISKDPRLLPVSEIEAASDRLQPFRITDEELEELLKEFLPT